MSDLRTAAKALLAVMPKCNEYTDGVRCDQPATRHVGEHFDLWRCDAHAGKWEQIHPTIYAQAIRDLQAVLAEQDAELVMACGVSAFAKAVTELGERLKLAEQQRDKAEASALAGWSSARSLAIMNGYRATERAADAEIGAIEAAKAARAAQPPSGEKP